MQTGRSRVKRALDVLQEVAGPSYPVLFLKTDVKEWTPVGEEDFVAKVSGKGNTVAVVVCDSEGNTKAMTSWSTPAEAERVLQELESKGLANYRGKVKLPV